MSSVLVYQLGWRYGAISTFKRDFSVAVITQMKRLKYIFVKLQQYENYIFHKNRKELPTKSGKSSSNSADQSEMKDIFFERRI